MLIMKGGDVSGGAQLQRERIGRAAQPVLIVLIRDARGLISLPVELRNIKQRGINDVTVSSYGFPETSRPCFSHCARFRREENPPGVLCSVTSYR